MWNIHSEQARKDFPRLEEFLSLLPQNRDYTVFPGFADVHVHLREPGFSYKETIASGTRAAAHGGYTAVCAMPNLNPVPDSGEHLEVQEAAIAAGAVIHVYPYGAITVGEQGEALADLAALAPRVCGFSDDGRGVQARAMMEDAMVEAKALGKVIAAHCEDNSLLHGGYIHDGQYARTHGHKGICSESEWGPIARDLELAAKTGCKYHVCHISTKESVELIRQAKKSGVDVTCETGPHYLVLDDSCLREDGRFKMNPPLRDRSDREALVEGLRDGTIDMIATDHAPHSAEEKARGLAKSAMGVVGIETAFPVVYTYLVKPGLVPLETVVNALTVNPRTRFGLPLGEDFSVWDLEDRYVIDPETFLSLGRATPFAGMEVQGRNLLTVCGGKAVWQAERS
ncbi:MAG TPA: dihydroorotase [Candidatus Avoscillospira stercorigallinarum]|uniref:Dihydroorotase n=1 Tax=Candidatus Avoscillospira stercorigallinarum TaxID=2840708 RepID=A0A9D0Z7L7_9FIRM|nr:dihydroorotase [Candidatus Avoscillospira stercorigallinarum]